jgi:hypothetical protein
VKVDLGGRWYTVILLSIGRKLAGACPRSLNKFLELIVHRAGVQTVRIHLPPAVSQRTFSPYAASQIRRRLPRAEDKWHPAFIPGPVSALPSNTQGRSRMLELGSSGSVRGCPAMGIPTAILAPFRPLTEARGSVSADEPRSFPLRRANSAITSWICWTPEPQICRDRGNVASS